MKKRFFNTTLSLLFSLFVVLFLTGCQEDPAPAVPFQAPEAPPEAPEMDALPPLPEAGSPDAMIRIFRQTAESLGMRDESVPENKNFVYFDEKTDLLLRLSIHGIDPDFLPESGKIEKNIGDEGDTVIALTLHTDPTVWIEAISVLPSRADLQEDAEEKIKDRMRAVKREFEAQLSQR